MDVYEAIRTVLAVREYQAKEVPAEVVGRIVEAGRLTASSQNGQPWHFIVVRERRMLERLGAVARSGRYTAQASFAVVVAIDRTRFAVSDGSRAIQSMVLAAWGEGVGSNWVGFMGPEEVKPLLGIPAGVDVLAILPFGYPLTAKTRGKKLRKPVSEVAHGERWGQPLV